MTKWVVKSMQNMTAGDTIWRGRSTQRFLGEDAFDTEDEALKHYRKQKAMLSFAGAAGMYYTFPVMVENYVETKPFEKFCDCCGEGIEDSNDTYTEIHGGDFCSKSCLNSGSNSEDGGMHDEERYYED